MAAVPTVVFAEADTIGGLEPALIATLVSGVIILGWQLRVRRQVLHPVLGTLLALACAAGRYDLGICRVWLARLRAFAAGRSPGW